MKKSLLALAVLGAFAGAAQAQSAVTIYGSFDGGVRHQSNVNGAGDNRLTMGSTGTYNSNRLGFKGVEDLGGGMNAHFTLETGFNTGTGALDAANTIFNRTAAVGLGGSWGSLDFGRQYTVAFKTIAGYEPFGYKFPGITGVAGTATAGVRYSNDIQYIGTFGPVTARAEYSLGETAGSTSTNASSAIGATYSAGPLNLGGAITKRDIAGADVDHWTVGGAYKFGPARVSVGHADQDTTTTDTKFTWIGLSYSISPAVALTGAYYRTKNTTATTSGEKDNFMLSATYALSKRTNLYALLDHAKLKGTLLVGAGTAATQDKQTGIAVGVNHLF